MLTTELRHDSIKVVYMLTPSIQLGARVRRRNDIGMDIPGAVVRVDGGEVLVYWPQDAYYELIPVTELELYGLIPELIAA